MQFDLGSIRVNHAQYPPRIVIYGDHGVGKTTFATSAPAPIVLPTEEGLAAIQVPTFPIARSYNDVLSALNTLYTQAHPFSTFVLDTLDWLEPLVWSHTAAMNNVGAIEDLGYGKGYIYADEYWRTILDGLNALNREKGMTIICLAHARIERFNAPETESYDRWQLKLHKRAVGLVSEWADVIGFAHQEIFTVTQDAPGGKKITKGTGGQNRILSVEERPAYDAKNRYSLPADLPFPKNGAWNAFAEACAPAYSAAPPAELNLVPPAPDVDALRKDGEPLTNGNVDNLAAELEAEARSAGTPRSIGDTLTAAVDPDLANAAILGDELEAYKESRTPQPQEA